MYLCRVNSFNTQMYVLMFNRCHTYISIDQLWIWMHSETYVHTYIYKILQIFIHVCTHEFKSIFHQICSYISTNKSYNAQWTYQACVLDYKCTHANDLKYILLVLWDFYKVVWSYSLPVLPRSIALPYSINLVSFI